MIAPAVMNAMALQHFVLNANQATITGVQILMGRIAIATVVGRTALIVQTPLMDLQELAPSLTATPVQVPVQVPVRVPATVVLSAPLLNSERPL